MLLSVNLICTEILQTCSSEGCVICLQMFGLSVVSTKQH